jgi:hypothetical protein
MVELKLGVSTWTLHLQLKSSSVMACLKIEAAKRWKFIKIDVGGAFLCADIDDTKKVFLLMDQDIANLVKKWMPEYNAYSRSNGKLVVKVRKAMYRLMQSSLLWYKELIGFLEEHRFKKKEVDRSVLHKITENIRK